MHRATAMIMLSSPPIPRGSRFVDAIHPVPVATTVKAASTKAMEAAFRSLLEFNPRTMDEIMGITNIYRRLGSPVELFLNWASVIAEGVTSNTHWALAFSDGMRAINAVLEFQLVPGDEVIVSKPLYGCTDNYFAGLAPRRGYTVKAVDLTDPQMILSALSPKTRIIYFETVTNPNLRVYDLETISRLAKGEDPNIMLVTDNTFPSPAGCNPLLHGADMVVHSMTKALGGFSQEMGGVAIVPKDKWMELFLHRKDTGGVIAPEQAHAVLTRGLPSLYTRFMGMQANAKAVAEYLDRSPYIASVSYPGVDNSPYSENARRLLTDWDGQFAPGFMIAFVPAGRDSRNRVGNARRMIDYIARHGEGVIKHAVSLGGVSSLIEMPFLGTHATVSNDDKIRWGVDKAMIRFSVGLAHSGDQIALLEDAIKYAYGA